MSGPERGDVEAEWRELWVLLPMNAFMGLELVACDREAGSATVAMPFRRELGNMLDDSGVHAGALASLVDATATFLVGVHVGTRETLTTDIRVDFVRWASAGRITCVAEVVYCGRRTALVDAVLHDEAGERVSVGRVSLTHRPEVGS